MAVKLKKVASKQFIAEAKHAGRWSSAQTSRMRQAIQGMLTHEHVSLQVILTHEYIITLGMLTRETRKN